MDDAPTTGTQFVDILTRIIEALRQRRRLKKQQEEIDKEQAYQVYQNAQRSLIGKSPAPRTRPFRISSPSALKESKGPKTWQGMFSQKTSPQMGERPNRGKRPSPSKGKREGCTPARRLLWGQEGGESEVGQSAGDEDSEIDSVRGSSRSWGSPLDLSEGGRASEGGETGRSGVVHEGHDTVGSSVSLFSPSHEENTGVTSVSETSAAPQHEKELSGQDLIRPTLSDTGANGVNLTPGTTPPAPDTRPTDCHQRAEEPGTSSTAPVVRRKQQPLRGEETVSATAPRNGTTGVLPVDPLVGRRGEGQVQNTNTRPGPAFSYAKAAAKGTGGRTGQGSKTPHVPEVDEWEDNFFLESFYARSPEEKNPRQRYVVRLRYLGDDMTKCTREYVERELLEKAFTFPQTDVLAIIIPMGMKEIDICFTTEKAYQQFLTLYRMSVQSFPDFMQDFNVVPLFRGETRVVTVFFRTTTIPAEDLGKYLRRHCTILQVPEKKRDKRGYWTGEFRVIVALERDPYTGRLKHLPKYFFLGADRGVVRYSGQPPACFQCGGFDHFRQHCVTELCSRCGVRGHKTSFCDKPVTCNLCAQQGHPYRLCPDSVINIQHPEVFEREVERTERAKRQEEEEREAHRLRQVEERQGSGGKGPFSRTEPSQDQTIPTLGNESRKEGEGWVQVGGAWKSLPRRSRGTDENRRSKGEGEREVDRQPGPSGTRFQALASLTEDEDFLPGDETQSDDWRDSRSAGGKGSTGVRKRQGDKRSPMKENGTKGSKPQREASLERKKVKKNPVTPRKEGSTKVKGGSVEKEVVERPTPGSEKSLEDGRTGSRENQCPTVQGEPPLQTLPRRIPGEGDTHPSSKATPQDPAPEGVEAVMVETPDPGVLLQDKDPQEEMEVQVGVASNPAGE